MARHLQQHGPPGTALPWHHGVVCPRTACYVHTVINHLLSTPRALALTLSGSWLSWLGMPLFREGPRARVCRIEEQDRPPVVAGLRWNTPGPGGEQGRLRHPRCSGPLVLLKGATHSRAPAGQVLSPATAWNTTGTCALCLARPRGCTCSGEEVALGLREAVGKAASHLLTQAPLHLTEDPGLRWRQGLSLGLGDLRPCGQEPQLVVGLDVLGLIPQVVPGTSPAPATEQTPPQARLLAGPSLADHERHCLSWPGP